MAIAKVTERFNDKHGHGGIYEVDDFYLHEDRMDALSTENNNGNRPFIKILTVPELKEELDKLKVDYETGLKKPELEALLRKELTK